MTNVRALRSESMPLRLSLDQIGGGVVVRPFRRGTEFVRVGTNVTPEELMSMTAANRNALLDKFIRVYPKPPSGVASRSDGVGRGRAERHIVPLGFGHYHVVEGVQLTQKPVTRQEAYSLAGKDLPAKTAAGD